MFYQGSTLAATTFWATGRRGIRLCRDMPGGGEIHKEVINAIHSAKIAILCISNSSIEREWLQRELNWCYLDYISEKYPLRRLIPVIVNDLDSDKIPSLIAETNIHRFNLSQPESRESDLAKLVADIQVGLGEPPPRVIPSTIFSITSETAERIFRSEKPPSTVHDLCRMVGMLADRRWVKKFLFRYGSTPEEFSPFPNEHVKSIVERATYLLNRARLSSPRIAIHWYSPSLLMERSPEGELARKHWRNDSQLLIIDALSILLDPQIREALIHVLALSVPNETRRAVLWIPPYTHYTYKLQELLRTAAVSVVQLEGTFEDWSTRPERNVCFDTATPVALTRWLNQVLRDLASMPLPIDANLYELSQQHKPNGLDPSYWFRASDPARF
jgi:hypothetical protein